jgi:hypothetical protein
LAGKNVEIRRVLRAMGERMQKILKFYREEEIT